MKQIETRETLQRKLVLYKKERKKNSIAIAGILITIVCAIYLSISLINLDFSFLNWDQTTRVIGSILLAVVIIVGSFLFLEEEDEVYDIEEKIINLDLKEVDITPEKKYLAYLTHNIGDLIHYQANDYKEKYPINSKTYEDIGSLLRFLSRNTKKHKPNKTIGDLSKEETNILKTICSDELLKSLSEFNTIMLIDLVTRMQGKTRDNVLNETINDVKIFNFKNS